MKRIILATILALASYGAYAFDANVSWTNATTYTDGALISANTNPLNVVASTQVMYGTCVGTAGAETFGNELGAMVAPWAGTSAVFTGLPDGKFCFRARHTTVGGESSVWSSLAVVTYSSKKKTRPPQNVTITIVAPLP